MASAGPTPARVTTLATMTAPINRTPSTPRAHRRYATTPSTHASTAMVRPMPTKSAALSLVPNVAIAKSFIHDGVKSMNVDPKGKDRGGAGLKKRSHQLGHGKHDAGRHHTCQCGHGRGTLEQVPKLFHVIHSERSAPWIVLRG
jgi:hypothetical protein